MKSSKCLSEKLKHNIVKIQYVQTDENDSRFWNFIWVFTDSLLAKPCDGHGGFTYWFVYIVYLHIFQLQFPK